MRMLKTEVVVVVAVVGMMEERGLIVDDLYFVGWR